MAEDIIKDFPNITEELQEIKRDIEVKKNEMPRPKIGSKRIRGSDYVPLAKGFIRKYTDDAVDKASGIRYQDEEFMIGDQANQDEVYIRTTGLWTLITDKSRKEDYERYEELLYETNVLYRNCDPRSSYPRAHRSKKGNKICRPIWEDF